MRWRPIFVVLSLVVSAMAMRTRAEEIVAMDEPVSCEIADSTAPESTEAPRALRRRRKPLVDAPCDVHVLAITSPSSAGRTSIEDPTARSVPADGSGENWLAEIAPRPPQTSSEVPCTPLGLDDSEAARLPPLDPRGRLASLRAQSWSPPDRRGDRLLEGTVDFDVPDDRPSAAHCGRRSTYVCDYDIEVAQSPTSHVVIPILAESLDGLQVAGSWERRGRRDGLALEVSWVDGAVSPFTTDRFYVPVTVWIPGESRDRASVWLDSEEATIELRSGRRFVLTTSVAPAAVPVRRGRSAASIATIDMSRAGEARSLSVSLDAVCGPLGPPSPLDPWAEASPGWTTLADHLRIRAILVADAVDSFDVLVDAWDSARTDFSWQASPSKGEPSTRLVAAPAARTLLRFHVPPGTSATRDVVLDVGRGAETWTVTLTR